MDNGREVTLRLAGKPLTFTTRIEACKPPYVPKAQPGVCPGAKRARKGAAAIARASVGRKVAQAVTERKLEETSGRNMLKMAAGEKFTADPKEIPDMLEVMDLAGPANLAMMNVAGDKNKNLYQHHLRDIPRDQMPALPDNVDDLMPMIRELSQMRDRDGKPIKVELVEIDPRDIQATQSQLSAPKVKKLAGYMKSGWKPGGAMIVSRENALGDGHHRWAAASMASLMHEQGVPGWQPVRAQALKIDLPIDDLLEVMERFSGPKKSLSEAP